MKKATLNTLLAAIAGIVCFVVILLAIGIPDKIATGNQAQIGIQMLDRMRPPMLAIEKAESFELHEDQMGVFSQSAQKLRARVASYLEAAQYNASLLASVTAFTVAVEGWLVDEQKLWEHRLSRDSGAFGLDEAKRLEEQHEAAVVKFLHALEVLALGEEPLHHDIDVGRYANSILQILSVLLILYLLSLIIVYQRVTKKELLISFHQVQAARQDLAQREEYLSLTLDSIGDAVIATDMQGHITRMNPVAEQLTGWDAQEALGQSLKAVFIIVNARTRKPVPDPVEKVLRSGEIVGLANHTVLISKDGTEFQIADSGSPIRDDHGNILGVILIFRDVTEEYRMQAEIQSGRDELEQRVIERTQELAQSNKELESFSYAVSHDLRAPLRSIHGFATALDEDNSAQLDEGGKHYLNRITSAVLRMGELIDAMLMLSRITRQDLQRTDVDLSQAAREIAEQLQEQDIDRIVEWLIAEDLHTHGDPDLLNIVLENLLGNAWKYSSKNTEKTCIEFGKAKHNGEQAFFVRDNGCGFNTDHAEKLFKAFQRLHGPEYEGTGIGLATVQRIIERHQGKIWASSETGNGAAFYFTLESPGSK